MNELISKEPNPLSRIKLKSIFPKTYTVITQALYKHGNGSMKRDDDTYITPVHHWREEAILRVAKHMLSLSSTKYRVNKETWQEVYDHFVKAEANANH